MVNLDSKKILICLMLVVVGYFIAKMFSRSCNGFSVGATEVNCPLEPCQNSGLCISGNRCSCLDEWEGTYCETLKPLPPTPATLCNDFMKDSDCNNASNCQWIIDKYWFDESICKNKFCPTNWFDESTYNTCICSNDTDIKQKKSGEQLWKCNKSPYIIGNDCADKIGTSLSTNDQMNDCYSAPDTKCQFHESSLWYQSNTCDAEGVNNCNQMSDQVQNIGLSGWQLLSDEEQKNMCENIYPENRGLNCKWHKLKMRNQCGENNNLLIFDLSVNRGDNVCEKGNGAYYKYNHVNNTVEVGKYTVADKSCAITNSPKYYGIDTIFYKTAKQIWETTGISTIDVHQSLPLDGEGSPGIYDIEFTTSKSKCFYFIDDRGENYEKSVVVTGDGHTIKYSSSSNPTQIISVYIAESCINI
jgi:hypothetical protein